MEPFQNTITHEEYRNIVEPYILDRLQHGFTNQGHEIDIKRFASLYGYSYEYAQKQLGILIRNLAKKKTPVLVKLANEEPKYWIESYHHNIDRHTYEIIFSNQLSKLVFNAFKNAYVIPKPRMTKLVG